MRDYETIPCPQFKCNQEFQAANVIDLVMPSHDQAATWWRKLIEKTTIDNLVYRQRTTTTTTKLCMYTHPYFLFYIGNMSL